MYVTEEPYVEKEVVKDFFKVVMKKDDKYQHQLLNKFNLKKSMHILAWVSHFISNSHIKNVYEQKHGPIVTEKIETQLMKMIKQYLLEVEGRHSTAKGKSKSTNGLTKFARLLTKN